MRFNVSILVLNTLCLHTSTSFHNIAHPPSKPLFLTKRTSLHSTVTKEDNTVAASSIADKDNVEKKSMTQRIMEKTSSKGQTGGAGGSSTWDAFVRSEQIWSKLKESSIPNSSSGVILDKDDTNTYPTFITDDGTQGNPKAWEALRTMSKPDYDVIVSGGTLGIFIALSLKIKNPNLGICVLEGGKIRGREQEWNISRKELLELVDLGLITLDEMENVITTEFPGCRSGFKNSEVTPLKGSYLDNKIGYECFTPNVLNLGISPTKLLEIVSKRFTEIGGIIIDESFVKGVIVSEQKGVALDIKPKNEEENLIKTSRLLLDCMGNASPITRQVRKNTKADGICIVMGTCASGYDEETNKVGDIIYTNTEIQDFGKDDGGRLQYFWEAFPVGIKPDGKQSTDTKTTYMFTYLDADSYRPSLTSIMDDYWKLLPYYQPSITNPEEDLDIHRVLFAFFPTYKDNSPLQSSYSRVLAVGDASGIQSPLSFGGFGALTRHLHRLTYSITEALDAGTLTKNDLSLINPYTPNLSVAWMFQKAMSIRQNQRTDPKFINRLLATNFEIMNDDMGVKTITPFLQDVIRIDGLLGSLSRSFIKDPLFMPEIISHVGILTLVDWLGHVFMLTLYTGLHTFVTPIVNVGIDNDLIVDTRQKYRLRRFMDAWKYGSGCDYVFEDED